VEVPKSSAISPFSPWGKSRRAAAWLPDARCDGAPSVLFHSYVLESGGSYLSKHERVDTTALSVNRAGRRLRCRTGQR
jgi:hypothetical protein